MTVKEATKIIEHIKGQIGNLHKIQHACADDPSIWEEFADQCGLPTGFDDFTATVIEALCMYRGMLEEKIDNAQL